MRTGNILRSAARAAPRLATGAASVTIGDDNLNEWRAVGTGAVLGFTLTARGRILVLTRDAVLYDSRVDGNEVYGPAGSYVFFAGVAGDTFHVRAKESVGFAHALRKLNAVRRAMRGRERGSTIEACA